MGNLSRQKNELVIKSNDLIRKTRYSLSEQEQKLLIYLISTIQADDKEFKKIKIQIKDFCSICGTGYDGRAMEHIQRSIKNLSDKSWWIKIDNDKEFLFRWIENAVIQRGTITLKLSEFLTPYLLQLKENFTKYELINVLVLKGKYSIRFYEIFKSFLWRHQYKVSIEELKSTLQCEHYKAYKDFRIRVLEPSLQEINAYSDLLVKYIPVKEGRRYVSIDFTIEEKQGIKMCFDMVIRQTERLSNE